MLPMRLSHVTFGCVMLPLRLSHVTCEVNCDVLFPVRFCVMLPVEVMFYHL